jgi:hypothetical protein
MRDIFFALIYLVCAALLAAFPVSLLFALFHEPKTQVAVRERAPAVQSNAAIMGTVGTTASTAESRSLAPPIWIVPTPEYNYDPSSIPAPSAAAALEAFAKEASPVTERERRRAKKPSASKESQHEPSPRRHAVVDTTDSEMRMGIVHSTADGRQVFVTPPLVRD